MKRKILACVLACMTLFLGFGYAAWTDSLQINGDVDTGELAVKFIDVRNFATLAESGDDEFVLGNDLKDGWVVYTGIPGNQKLAADYFDDTLVNQYADPDGVNLFANAIKTYTKTSSDIARVTEGALAAGVDDHYGTDAIVSDGIKITLHELYPGYAQLFKTDIINTGTLAAKLTDIDTSVELLGQEPNDKILDMIGVALDAYDEENGNLINMIKYLDNEDFFTFKGTRFIRLSALEDFTAGGLGDLLLINPGENTMDIVFGVAMDPDWDGVYTTGRVTEDGVVSAENNDAASQNGSANFEIKFKWDQMNATGPVPADVDDDDEEDIASN